MDLRTLTEFSTQVSSRGQVPDIVRQAVLELHAACTKQQEEVKAMRNELALKVSTSELDATGVELRTALRKKADVEYVNQQLDNKASVLDMYNALKPKANATDVTQMLAEKASADVVASKASKNSVASALRKKCSEVEDKVRADLRGLAAQVASLQAKVDSAHYIANGHGLKDTLTESLAEKAEVLHLRSTMQDTVQMFMVEKQSADAQLRALAASMQEMQQQLLSATKASAEGSVLEMKLKRDLQALRDAVADADLKTQRDRIVTLVQQEVGYHFSRLAEMQEKMQMLDGKVGELSERDDREQMHTCLGQLQNALDSKAEARDLVSMRRAYQREIKALLTQATAPLCQKLQALIASVDRLEGELERFTDQLDHKVSHADFLALVDTKCDRDVSLQVADLSRRLTELSTSYRMSSNELSDGYGELLKQVSGKPDREDVMHLMASAQKDIAPQELLAQVKDWVIKCTDPSRGLEAVHKRLKTLSVTTEQVSETILDLRKRMDVKLDAVDAKTVLRQQQETALLQMFEDEGLGDVRKMKEQLEIVSGLQRELSMQQQQHHSQSKHFQDLDTAVHTLTQNMELFRASLVGEFTECRRCIDAKIQECESSLASFIQGQHEQGPQVQVHQKLTDVEEALQTMSRTVDHFRASIGAEVAECQRAVAAKVSIQDFDLQLTDKLDIEAFAEHFQQCMCNQQSEAEQRVTRAEFLKEVSRLDQSKLDRAELEPLLGRKVDLQMFCERLAAKANHTDLHNWAEDLNREIQRRLQVKTDLRQFEMLAKEVDSKVDVDKLHTMISHNAALTSAVLRSAAAPLIDEESSLHLSWSSNTTHDGLS